MELTINGEKKSIEQETVTVTELLTINSVQDPEMVSVQVNGEFVTREDFPATSVKDGDEVDFLYFMGGGQQ